MVDQQLRDDEEYHSNARDRRGHARNAVAHAPKERGDENDQIGDRPSKRPVRLALGEKNRAHNRAHGFEHARRDQQPEGNERGQHGLALDEQQNLSRIHKPACECGPGPQGYPGNRARISPSQHPIIPLHHGKRREDHAH